MSDRPSIAEANDRRMPLDAAEAPWPACGHCGSELVRVGLRLVCEGCGYAGAEVEEAV